MEVKRVEEDMLNTMWAFLQLGGPMKPNYPVLKTACLELSQMLTQKTAGQRKDNKKDLSWDNLPRVKNTIIMEVMALVLSGALEDIPGLSPETYPQQG